MADDEKYAVFKADDWNTIVDKAAEDAGYNVMVSTEWFNRMLQDAVVIRTQDIFAGPGLSAYANCIQTAIDLMREVAQPVSLTEHITRLEEIRDYFFERAQEAFDRPDKHIPD